jgi:hypothetical protein
VIQALDHGETVKHEPAYLTEPLAIACQHPHHLLDPLDVVVGGTDELKDAFHGVLPEHPCAAPSGPGAGGVRSPEPQRPRVWLLRAEKTTVVTLGEKTRATMLAAGTTAGGDLCMRYDGFYIHMTVYNIVYNYYPNES